MAPMTPPAKRITSADVARLAGVSRTTVSFVLNNRPGQSIPEETRHRIDDVRLGIEIASSPYPRINADGPAVTASDFGNNFGLVLGPRVANWRATDLSAIEVSSEIDGRIVGAGTAASMLDGPFGAVRFLLANLAEFDDFLDFGHLAILSASLHLSRARYWLV